jgi:hypothetical protein
LVSLLSFDGTAAGLELELELYFHAIAGTKLLRHRTNANSRLGK